MMVLLCGLAWAGMAGCMGERDPALAGEGERVQAAEPGDKEENPGPAAPEIMGEAVQQEPAPAGPAASEPMPLDMPLTDQPQTGAEESGPEKLDEWPGQGVALYQIRDEAGNSAQLLLEIDGRIEMIWPAGVRWAYLNEADADQDGTAEIVVTYTAGGGTGVNDGRMAVYRRDFTDIPFDDPLEALENAMAMSMDHDKREIVLETDGRSWRIPFPDGETEWWPEPYIGHVVHYFVRDGRISANVGLQASIAWFPADLVLGYEWNGERLAATAPDVYVHKETGVAYRYEDRQAGLSLRVPAGWSVDKRAFVNGAAGEAGFTVLVEGHPDYTSEPETEDGITFTGTGDRQPLRNRLDIALKEAWEQVDVTLASGEQAALHLVRLDGSVELLFWSDKAAAVGVLREDTFDRHRDALLAMFGSLEALE